MTTVITGKIQLPPRRADDKRLNIAIATPAYKGEFSTAYVRSLFMLVTAAPAMGLRFSFSDFDYSDIVTSRNYLLSNFFYNMTNCSHLLFIDADMGLPKQADRRDGGSSGRCSWGSLPKAINRSRETARPLC